MIFTASEMANKIGISVYTLKRWYKWYENTDAETLEELYKKGMPELPKYKTIGTNLKWKFWDETAIEQLIKFKEFVPHTRAGFMGKANNKKGAK